MYRLYVKNLDKQKVFLSNKILREAILYLLNLLKIKKAQVSVYFVGRQRMVRLNKNYLRKNNPTDVLTFDLSNDKKNIFAEIFICIPITRKNAKLYNNSFAKELLLYIIHGLLHILGFDDKNKSQRLIMFKKQDKLLNLLSFYLKSKYKIKIS